MKYHSIVSLVLLTILGIGDLASQDVSDLIAVKRLKRTPLLLIDELGFELRFIDVVTLINPMCGYSPKNLAIVWSGDVLYYWLQNGVATRDTTGNYDVLKLRRLLSFDYDAVPGYEIFQSSEGIYSCLPSDSTDLSKVLNWDCDSYTEPLRSYDVNLDGYLDIVGRASNAMYWYQILRGGMEFKNCDSVVRISGLAGQVPIDLPFNSDRLYALSTPIDSVYVRKIYLNQLNIDYLGGVRFPQFSCQSGRSFDCV